jgi:predicted DNA-binding protein (MmcQ/YjbR family)
MSIEFIRQICKSLKGVTEDVKWGNDLCFCVGEKMFCVTSIEGPFNASFKCSDEDFAGLTERENIIPAPYMARNKWVHVEKASALKKSEWEEHVLKSYKLVASKLPKKVQKEIGLIIPLRM